MKVNPKNLRNDHPINQTDTKHVGMLDYPMFSFHCQPGNRIETQTGGLGVQVLDLVLSINSTLTLPFFSFDPARCSKYNPSSQSQAFL